MSEHAAERVRSFLAAYAQMPGSDPDLIKGVFPGTSTEMQYLRASDLREVLDELQEAEDLLDDYRSGGPLS